MSVYRLSARLAATFDESRDFISLAKWFEPQEKWGFSGFPTEEILLWASVKRPRSNFDEITKCRAKEREWAPPWSKKRKSRILTPFLQELPRNSRANVVIEGEARFMVTRWDLGFFTSFHKDMLKGR